MKFWILFVMAAALPVVGFLLGTEAAVSQWPGDLAFGVCALLGVAGLVVWFKAQEILADELEWP